MKIYYAVIDINVLISSMLKNVSVPGKIIDLISEEKIIPVVNNKILTEYLEVVQRPKFNFSTQSVHRHAARDARHHQSVNRK